MVIISLLNETRYKYFKYFSNISNWMSHTNWADRVYCRCSDVCAHSSFLNCIFYFLRALLWLKMLRAQNKFPLHTYEMLIWLQSRLGM